MPTKACNTCKLEKSLECFNKNSASRDGRQAKCRDCYRLYYQDNRDKFLERNRTHYKENPEYYRQHNINWRNNNPDKVREKQQTRRSRVRNLHVEVVRISVLRERDGDNCGICGIAMTFLQLKRGEYVPTNWEHEHLKAISQGGENSYENSTLLCSRCNRSKQGKTIPEFVRYREARGLPIQLNAHVAKVVHESTYSKEATCTSSTGA